MVEIARLVGSSSLGALPWDLKCVLIRLVDVDGHLVRYSGHRKDVCDFVGKKLAQGQWIKRLV